MPSMAIKNRKLFPALSSMNQTEECSDLCIPGCPYNCYPYTDYYFSQPPPPPLSPPPPMIPEEHSLSPYIIVTITLLACFFLFLSYYVFVAKSYPRWCCLRRESEGQGGNNTDDEFTEGSQIDHPIWFVTTIGLHQSLINSIAMFKYKKGEGLIDGSECSVCLGEFQENETLRLLPKCSHAFHVSCIDTWLRSHTNCPLCRANIVVDGPSNPLVGNAQNPDDGDVVGSTRIQDSQVAYGTSNDHQRDENGVEDVNERADVGAEGNLKEDVNVNGYGDGSETEKINMISVGRRFSMNSVKAEETVYLDLGYQTSLHIDLVDHDERGRSSISHCLRISPIPMKRSSSCSGRFFSSRHNQLLKYALQS